jgi:hypothetical protein
MVAHTCDPPVLGRQRQEHHVFKSMMLGYIKNQHQKNLSQQRYIKLLGEMIILKNTLFLTQLGILLKGNNVEPLPDVT